MPIQPINERVLVRDLKDPVLITAFSSPQKGGATATTALGYAIERWQAEPVTSFEAEGCYNYVRMRPWVRRAGDTTVVHWPENIVYRVDGPDHSYLLLIGVEPMLNWRQFVEGIGDFALRHGIRTVVSLKSASAMIPHTLDAPVRAIYSAPEMRHEFPFEELEHQDGPADIGRVLNLHLAAQGCRTIDLYAMEPFYAAAIPDASASLSLLQALRDGFSLAVDLEDLRQAAEMQRQAIDSTVASSEQLRQTVAALEQGAVAAGLSRNPALLSSPVESELDTAAVMREAEDIFRDFTSGRQGLS